MHRHCSESSLESFHLMLAHFGNIGMRESLADNLNLTGTARSNLTIRHRLRLAKLTDENTRKKIPAAWEDLPAYWNHLELAFVNDLASKAGATKLPFHYVEELVSDTGERFFSEYLAWLSNNSVVDEKDLCLCRSCSGVGTTQEMRSTNALAVPNSERVSDGANTATPIPVIPPPFHHNSDHNPPPPPNPSNNFPPMPAVAPPLRPMIVPIQWMPFPTFPFANMFQPQQQPHFCCDKYRIWCGGFGRRGRPPHNDYCYKRQQQNNAIL